MFIPFICFLFCLLFISMYFPTFIFQYILYVYFCLSQCSLFLSLLTIYQSVCVSIYLCINVSFSTPSPHSPSSYLPSPIYIPPTMSKITPSPPFYQHPTSHNTTLTPLFLFPNNKIPHPDQPTPTITRSPPIPVLYHPSTPPQNCLLIPHYLISFFSNFFSFLYIQFRFFLFRLFLFFSCSFIPSSNCFPIFRVKFLSFFCLFFFSLIYFFFAFFILFLSQSHIF